MTWQNITYLISIIITAAVMAFIAWYSRKYRATVTAAGVYMWIALLVSIVSVFQGLSMIGPSNDWALFWFNLRIAGFAAMPVIWIIFILIYIGKTGLITKYRIAALFIIPVITQVMLWTNDWHGLWVARDVAFNRAGPFFVPLTSVRVPGPWYGVHIVYTNALMLAGLIILVVMSIRMRRQDRGQALTLGAGTLIMIVGALFPAFNMVPGMVLNPLPQSFALGSLVIAWGLYRHRFLGEKPLIDPGKKIPASLAALFVMLVAGIITTGFVYYSQYREHQRTSVKEELSSIADLKVNEIVQWRKERIGDGSMLYGNDVFNNLALRFLADPADTGARWELQSWLEILMSASRYTNIQLLDAQGSPRLSVSGEKALALGYVKQHLDEIRQSGKVEIIDFHRDAPDRPIHLSVIVPLNGGVPGGVPAGFVVLFIDPAVYLYPLISRWPTPSKTAETLLVRRDGSDVLFLNELRFRNNAALKLRMPLKDLRIPAVRAALGREGYMEGIDYRGVPVVAVVHAVSGSPWFMVARMDMDEVYAPVREHFWFMVIAVVTLIAGTGAGVGLLWRRQGERFIRERLEAADVLRESEEKFSRAFQTAPYAITITDPEDGRFVDVNEAFFAITGYTSDDIAGSSSIGLSLWVNDEDRKQVLDELMSGAKVAGREFQFKKKNNDIITGLFSADIIQLKTGRFFLSSINDITNRKRAEKALKESEDKFRGIFEYSTVGKSLTAPDGKLLHVNRAFADMLGYTIEELQQVNFSEITYPDDIAESRESIRCLLANERDFYRMEKRYFSKNGSIVWADVSTRLHRDEKGKPEYMITSIIDITGRKRAEDARRKSERRLREAQEMAHLGYWTWDIKTGDVEWSEEVYRIFRLDQHKFTPRIDSILELSPWPEDHERDRELIKRAIESHEPGFYEQKFLRPDRSVGYYYSNFQGNYDERGDLVSIVGTILDITDRKVVEVELNRFAAELERSNVDLQQFAYVASHDLQEPLRMISSYLQLIERRYKDKLDSDANDFINFAVGGASRLQALISGLLEFSRVRTHGKPFESVNVNDVLENVRRDLDLQIEETGATVSCGEMPVIQADAVQIARLFQNLVQNAIKFRREGAAPVIQISAEQRNNEHVFCVRDNGIGIEEQYRERIFIIFQRLHGREEYPGTGIGLSICKRIVERHGGSIWVESTPGEGSVFYFSIPA